MGECANGHAVNPLDGRFLMAFVSRGWRFTMVVADSEGSTSTVQYMMSAAVDTLAEAVIIQNLVIGNWASISDSVIKQYGVSEIFEDDAFALPAGVEIEKRAVITARLATTFPKYANITIPAPNQAIFLATTGPNAKVVDVNNADLQQHLDLFFQATGFLISDGERLADPSVAGNVYGHKAHRRSKRG